jgi:hypothetical protein
MKHSPLPKSVYFKHDRKTIYCYTAVHRSLQLVGWSKQKIEYFWKYRGNFFDVKSIYCWGSSLPHKKRIMLQINGRQLEKGGLSVSLHMISQENVSSSIFFSLSQTDRQREEAQW